jgi:hypothetical protein
MPQCEGTILPEIRVNKGFSVGMCRASWKTGSSAGAFLPRDNAYGILSKSAQIVFCRLLKIILNKREYGILH